MKNTFIYNFIENNRNNLINKYFDCDEIVLKNSINDIINDDGDTILIKGSRNNCDVNILEKLIQYGANVNQENKFGENAFTTSIDNYNFEHIELFIKNKGNIDKILGKNYKHRFKIKELNYNINTSEFWEEAREREKLDKFKAILNYDRNKRGINIFMYLINYYGHDINICTQKFQIDDLGSAPISVKLCEPYTKCLHKTVNVINLILKYNPYFNINEIEFEKYFTICGKYYKNNIKLQRIIIKHNNNKIYIIENQCASLLLKNISIHFIRQFFSYFEYFELELIKIIYDYL